MSSHFLKNLIECLEGAQEELRDCVPRLNNGGCGVFALELVKRLELCGVTDYAILVEDWGHNVSIDDVRQNVRENGANPLNIFDWYKNGFFIPHIWVRCGEYYIDGHETIDGSNTDFFDGELTKDELEAFVNVPSAWNDCYDRSDNETVCWVLDEYFSLLNEPTDIPELDNNPAKPFNPLTTLPAKSDQREIEETA